MFLKNLLFLSNVFEFYESSLDKYNGEGLLYLAPPSKRFWPLGKVAILFHNQSEFLIERFW